MIEKIILSNLIGNEEYSRKIIPYLLKEYFFDRPYQIIFELIQKYIVLYNTIPTKEALLIDLIDKENVSDEEKATCDNSLTDLVADPQTNLEWLIDKTEEFCKEKALYLALTKSFEMYEKREGLGNIPKLLIDALSISFDPSIGNDFFDDAPERFKQYHLKENKIPFNIDVFNKITRGGVSRDRKSTRL